ncbi:PAS domain S-box protein [Pirellulaceae bacterium SH501]
MIQSISVGLILSMCYVPPEELGGAGSVISPASQLGATCCVPAASSLGDGARKFEAEGPATFVSKLFDTSSFPARWYCGTWATDVGWLHIASDVGIFTAYFAIPCVLLFFMLRKKDLPFPKVIWLFATFIMACGFGHLIEASIFWWPVYRFSGLVKCFTAIISWVTVFALIRIMPAALRLPSAALLASNLLKSQERLDIALGAAAIGVLEVDLVEDKVTADQRTREIFGLMTMDSSGTFEQICSRIHADDKKQLNDVLRNACENRSPFEAEFRVSLADGAIRFVQYRGKYVVENNGSHREPLGLLIGVCIDVTEKRLKDAALLESEQNFRGTFENAAIGIAQVSIEGRWTKVNPVLCSILGYTEDELLGMTSQAITYEDDKDSCEEKTHEAIRGVLQSFCLEKRYMRKDGEAVWVRVSASVVRDTEGRPTHFVKVIEDIHRRKQTELELQQYHERVEKLSLVASKTQHSVVITDANGKIEWCNEAFSRLTGYELREVVGRKPGEFLQGEQTDPEAIVAIRKSLLERSSIAIEIVNYDASGKSYWIELKIDPVLDDSGTLTNYIATQIDITERKKFEQNLCQAKQAAELANKAKSEFLAAMSHELRTPLNGVIGMAELLAESNLDQRQKSFVDTCRRSGQALLTLINDILDFSKIESGKLELDSHPFELMQLAYEAVDVIAYRAEQKGVKLRLYSKNPGTLPLLGDSHRLRQVLTNLVGNAVKFTDQGSVTVEIDVISSSDQNAQVRFKVKDTGIGIPADRLQDLFKEFSQVDRSASRRFNGSGLGLSISKSIVEAMGGTIGVNSIEGIGSEFWFQVSFQRDRASQYSTPVSCEGTNGFVSLNKDRESSSPSTNVGSSVQDTSRLANSIRVLLAEDNPTNQMFAQEVISRQGWICEVVDNGRRAVEAIHASHFDLVLMDCQMPEMDGFAATAAIRRREQETGSAIAIPIIALTANAIKGDRERCLLSGMDAYLPKPFAPKSLLELIHKLVLDRNLCVRDNDINTQHPDRDEGLQKPFDETQFLEDRCMGDSEFAVSLLDSFLSTSSERVQELTDYLKSGDIVSAGEAAHSLKGSAGILFAERLSLLAERIEKAGALHDYSAVESIADELVEEVEACHRAIVACKHKMQHGNLGGQETRVRGAANET